VSIIVAVVGEDHLLVGADGKGSLDEDPKAVPSGFPPRSLFETEKIRPVAGLPLMWGMAGNTGFKREFAAWVDVTSFRTWDHLRDLVSAEVLKFNNMIRDAMSASGAKAEPKDLFSVMFAGYLPEHDKDAESTPQVLETNDDGTTAWLTEITPAAIGLFGAALRAAVQVAGALKADFSMADPETFRKALEAFVMACLGHLLPPVDVWEITRERGCVHL